MGSSFKKAIFDEHIQQGISAWARNAKMNKKKAANGSSHTNPSQAGRKEAEMALVNKVDRAVDS